jgi:hypothetical protein
VNSPPFKLFLNYFFTGPNKCGVGLDGHIIFVSTTDALFGTFTESIGGYSIAEQLEVVFTARL